MIAAIGVTHIALPVRSTADIVIPSSEHEQGVDHGFKAHVADDEVVTALADFERRAQEGAWEKAFKALDEMHAAKAGSLVRSARGVLVPIDDRIFEAVGALSPEGRKAFLLFYEARAQQLLDDALQAKAEEQVALAMNVYKRYFLTPAGAQAANLLGDAYFQIGKFAEAERCWQRLQESHPGHDFSEVRLRLKRAIAMRRAQHHEKYEQLAHTLRNQFVGETALIGGQNVQPGEVLDALEEGGTEDSELSGGSTMGLPQRVDIGNPGTKGPEWRIRFLSERDKKRLVMADGKYHGGPKDAISTYVPPIACDGRRVYCNWLGVCFAVDMNTGKLLWRSDSYSKLVDQLGEFVRGRSSLSQYAIVADASHVIAVTLPVNRIGRNSGPYRLRLFDAATGNMQWDSMKISTLSETSFVGRPLMHGELVLVVTHENDSSRLVLSAFSLATGETAWELPLGDVTTTRSRRGSHQIKPLPELLTDRETLYIMTSGGAFISVDLHRRAINWLCTYRMPRHLRQSWDHYRSRPMTDAERFHSRGRMLLHDDIMYIKEGRSDRLYAMDLVNRRLAWERPVSEAATLVGMDNDSLYLLSNELDAIDRITRDLRWSRTLPVKVGGLSALVGRERILVFTSRGIYEMSKKNGDVLDIYRGHELSTGGGMLTMMHDRFLCVSGQSISAYPIVPPD